MPLPLLKIITFNVYLLCIGPFCLLREVPDIESRQAQIAVWLKEQNADIVFLQEVWQAEQFDYLKKESGYPYGIYFGPLSEMGILSRTPITGADYIPNRWQGSYAEDCKKGVVGYRYGLGVATVDVQGTEIFLANTHPIARRGDVEGFRESADRLTPERKFLLLEYRLLLKDRIATRPVLFAGDFNMNRQSAEYDFFRRLFPLNDAVAAPLAVEERKGDEPFCSYCESNRYAKRQGNPSEHVIDHIFFNGFFEPVSARIDFPKPDLSDHQPVEATLQINLNPPPTSAPTVDRLPPEEIDSLIAYFEKVSLSPYCYLSYELGWIQKQKTLHLLKELNRRTQYRQTRHHLNRWRGGLSYLSSQPQCSTPQARSSRCHISPINHR
ncbi:MAG: endonuclease/exonuclease/phosphatase family protein [Deltaproteobacteria bacterium]|nr:endonuclease/exonuclease/phosphatase family protein [Deltaproteobacteria bacterium]